MDCPAVTVFVKNINQNIFYHSFFEGCIGKVKDWPRRSLNKHSIWGVGRIGIMYIRISLRFLFLMMLTTLVTGLL